MVDLGCYKRNKIKEKMKPTVLPIMLYSSPCLTTKCNEVEEDYAIYQLVSNMRATLQAAKEQGIGLAANQIGITKRVFIIGDKEFINPVIKKAKGSFKKDFESCLSIPEVRGRVGRWQKIELVYTSLDKERKVEIFKGFEARVIQHLVDRLNGVDIVMKFDKHDIKMSKGVCITMEEKGEPNDLKYDTMYEGEGKLFQGKE